MKENTNRINFLVGVFVLLGILALLFLIVKVTSFDFSEFNNDKKYKLVAYFDNVGNLKERAPVKSSGILIGRVSSVSLDTATYRAKVEITIASSYQFPQDSSLKILTAGVLGEQYLGMEPGGDNKMLHDNDRVKFTQSALVLENLIGQFMLNRVSDVKPSAQGN